MQTVKISTSICAEVERIAWRFILGSFEAIKKPSLVKSEDVCQPLSNRRLSIRSLKEQNESFMLKLGFNLLANDQALWVKVLRYKYRLLKDCPDDIYRSNCSFV